jgi:hypothetical protein
MLMVYKLRWVLMDNPWVFGLLLEEKAPITFHLTQKIKNLIKQYLDIKIQNKDYFGSMIML